jgi:hypothetical protein
VTVPLDHAQRASRSTFGWTRTAEQRDEYDYLTVYARTTLPGVPSSFKGLSANGTSYAVRE